MVLKSLQADRNVYRDSAKPLGKSQERLVALRKSLCCLLPLNILKFKVLPGLLLSFVKD